MCFWGYMDLPHDPQKVSKGITQLLFFIIFFSQRINKNHQVYPPVVMAIEIAPFMDDIPILSGCNIGVVCWLQAWQVGMGRKRGISIISNLWRENHYTKIQLWKRRMWSNIKFRGMFLFSDEDKLIQSFGCLQFFETPQKLPLEAFAAFALFCFVAWLASTFCAGQCWRITKKNQEVSVFFFPKHPQTCVHTEGFLRSEFRPVLDQGAHSWAQQFPCKFSHKMALVTCPCAFLTAQARSKFKVWVAVLGRGIFPENPRIKWPLWHVHVHFECASLHKTCG